MVRTIWTHFVYGKGASNPHCEAAFDTFGCPIMSYASSDFLPPGTLSFTNTTLSGGCSQMNIIVAAVRITQ